MRAIDVRVGMLVDVREPERWEHVDGTPIERRPFRVTEKYNKDGYKEPWIKLDDGGVYRAKDLRPAEALHYCGGPDSACDVECMEKAQRSEARQTKREG